MSVLVSPLSSDLPGRASQRRRVRIPVLPARAGDHAAIHHFLTSVFQAPSRAEFKAAIEDPYYEPCDRLLLKRGPRIVAHVHLTHRVMHFGPLHLPAAGLGWLAVAPECQDQGLGNHLLNAAEKQMAQTGALVGLIRTQVPHFFRRTGWAVCGRHSFSQAGARAVLSQLLDQGLRRRRFHVRPWRRWEEGALVRLYNQNAARTYGHLDRMPTYWQWLMRRRAYDQVYVALDGPDLLDLDETRTRIVGYAAVRGQRIYEIMSAPGQRRAAAELLARACDDAIEHDRQEVILHAPPDNTLHPVFLAAGGVHVNHAMDRGEVYMARLLHPVKVLESLAGEFHRRAEEARLPRPLDFGLLVEGKRYQLSLGAEKVEVVGQLLGRSYLRLNVADFTRLVLGQIDWDRALTEGRVEPSTALAEEAGRALFPDLPFWRPPWDDLPA